MDGRKMRRDRGKSVEEETWGALDYRCRRHPAQSGLGICALCLKERLTKLVCPDCGEQRPSSCSCSEASSSSSSAINGNGNGNGNGGSVDVGSVGRISFLIERDRPDYLDPSKPDAIVLLRRAKSAACRAPPGVEPRACPPEASPKKKSLWSFLQFPKRKKQPAEPKETVDRLVKSRSVGVGRRSFSGYGFLWDKSSDTPSLCTPSRSVDRAPGGNGNGVNDSQGRSSSGRSRGWTWAFSSPMRVFKHSGGRRVPPRHANAPSESPLVEMCRG